MTGILTVTRAGPAITVQDMGRPGHMAQGLSVGGAADRLALIEGAALLGQSIDCAAIEMAAFGGDFSTTIDMRIALTGAPMKASVDGDPLVWNASHMIKAGQKLSIGAATSGVYGYLHIGGGIATEPVLQSRSAHLSAGLGGLIAAGDTLAIGPDSHTQDVGITFIAEDRFHGGVLRLLPSVQTHRFTPVERSRFEATTFTRTPRGNRQGVELAIDGQPFASPDQLTILSEPMVAGDVQMTGAGIPFVLLPECQTTGGYPRIGTIVPGDLPKIAQATTGTRLSFQFIEFDDALATHKSPMELMKSLKSSLRPLVRDPRSMRNLLTYEMIGGVVNALE